MVIINKPNPLDEEPRVGVFVCHCGSNIGGLVDCKKLAEYVRELPDVAYSEHNLYTCSDNGLKSIQAAIKEHHLNRVVIASCSPRTHEKLFQETIQDVGLNKYMFNFVNIRDQCTWVHMKEPEAAFEKCKDLLRMGVSKVVRLEPLEDVMINVTPSALVIGGGISGMSAALNLSNQGFKMYIVEKEDRLGGLINNLYKIFPTRESSSDVLNKMKEKVLAARNLEIFTLTTVKEITGYIGNYEVLLDYKGEDREIKVGAIIVATGASYLTPSNEFWYDGEKRITQLELEKRLKEGAVLAKNIVMIQCVGSRNEERKYCSSVCCATAQKNAMILKEQNPDANITILFRDIYSPGPDYEEYYRKAREAGIVFMKYSPEKKPKVNNGNIVVFNEYIGEVVSLPYDLLVLSTPMISNETNKDLAQLLKVPLEENGFFLEAHVKLRPIDFATDGIFLSGTAKWPVNIAESTEQGYAAASRASRILSHNTLEVDGTTAFLPEADLSLCTGCNICIRICPFHAIVKDEQGFAHIQEALCKGCGMCGATCPEKAISIKQFSDDQIMAEILAFGGR